MNWTMTEGREKLNRIKTENSFFSSCTRGQATALEEIGKDAIRCAATRVALP